MKYKFQVKAGIHHNSGIREWVPRYECRDGPGVGAVAMLSGPFHSWGERECRFTAARPCPCTPMFHTHYTDRVLSCEQCRGQSHGHRKLPEWQTTITATGIHWHWWPAEYIHQQPKNTRLRYRQDWLEKVKAGVFVTECQRLNACGINPSSSFPCTDWFI